MRDGKKGTGLEGFEPSAGGFPSSGKAPKMAVFPWLKVRRSTKLRKLLESVFDKTFFQKVF